MKEYIELNELQKFCRKYTDEDVRQLEVIELKDVLEIFKRNIGE